MLAGLGLALNIGTSRCAPFFFCVCTIGFLGALVIVPAFRPLSLLADLFPLAVAHFLLPVFVLIYLGCSAFPFLLCLLLCFASC